MTSDSLPYTILREMLTKDYDLPFPDNSHFIAAAKCMNRFVHNELFEGR